MEAIRNGQKSQDFRLITKHAFWQHCIEASDAVLDLGCGAGVFSRALSEAGACVYALEANRKTLFQAKSYLPKVKLVGGLANALPFPKAFFTGIICTEVLSHVPFEHQLQVVCEMHRVLKPSGQIAISVHNPGRLHLAEWLHARPAKEVYPNPGETIYPIDQHRLLDLFTKQGFQVLEKPLPVNFYQSIHVRQPHLAQVLNPVEAMLQYAPILKRFSIANLAFFQKTAM